MIDTLFGHTKYSGRQSNSWSCWG